MAKRPHGDVERTKEDLDEEFYAGIGQMRSKAGMEMQRWGYRPKIILPLPLFLPPPSAPARVLPGAEALAAASYATVVHAVLDHQRVVNASSPAAGAASSSAPAMLDGTASGQDAGTGEAPVPDLNTASGQDAAPVPNRDTASGQHEPKIEPGSAHDGSASGQISRDPPPKRRRMVKGGSDPDAYERLPEEDLPVPWEETTAMMIEDEDVYQDVDAVPGVLIPRSMPRGAFFQSVIMPWFDEKVYFFFAL